MRRTRPAERLTKRVVEAAVCPPDKKDAWFFDGQLRGFALRVTSQGSKVFYLQYRGPARLQRLRLGEYGALTVEQARRKAEAARGQVAGGGDPVADRQAQRAAAEMEASAKAFTLRALVQAWRALHLDLHRDARYAAESERTILTGFAAWADRPVVDLTTAVIRRELAGILEERGFSAQRRTQKVLRAALQWAVHHGRLESNPAATLPPAMKPKARDRALSDTEIGAVWRAMGALGMPFAPFLRMLMLTLQRREEVAGMRWSEVSADLATWTQPAERTKNGKAHVVQLSEPARAILREQPRMAGSDFVFTTTGRTSLSGFQNAKERLDRLVAEDRTKAGLAPAAIAPWRLHDLRRTGVTVMARLGVSPDVADRILNHSASSTNEGVKAVYQVYEFTRERARALDRWAAHVLACAGQAGQGGNVVPLARVRQKPAR